ncbi:hypothetical protein GGI25_004793 [Coemansia spiralis]|uniref:ZZ-type domain-containing protein n=2 Tax=Coemansia TaxID=4863 RepID=A0A9W8KV85_9FUNG|nr:hypothetical protein EDC05_004772 [Coemansia umbellata]KAJ2620247.1 hypothetical protein GGI26_005136 [Coemansia sp. RSA 1358]KAJ2673199.1 hypothetical protein GGI25_004793 [Coemansia spiralis]
MLVYHAIGALRSQLERAKSDMHILARIRDQALARPMEYVESVMAGTAPKAPSQQAVVDVPSIHIEPYLSHADPKAVQSYLGHIQTQTSLRKSLFAIAESSTKPAVTATGSNVVRLAPIRHLVSSGRSTSTKIRSISKRGSRQPASAKTNLLTGNTAVATPEHSPQRVSGHLLARGVTALGLNNMQRSDDMPLALTLDSSTNLYSAPSMGRANTEPIRRSSVTRSEPGAGSKSDAASGQQFADLPFKSGINTSATQPGTPTGRAKSQKTLTPQMLEEFRRRVSEERSQSPGLRSQYSTNDAYGGDGAAGASDENNDDDDDEDDEYYNQLVQAATEEHMQTVANAQNGLAPQTPAVLSAVGHRTAGKSLYFGNTYSQPRHETSVSALPSSNGAHLSTPRRKGRPKKSAMGTATPGKNKKPKYGRRGPTRGDPDTPKPASYNLPWSDEEQQRLMDLLLIYPEEEIANSRWRKIAEALGTRTMRQVASRVQKYFIKLAKAGLPVPGKVPDTSNWTSIGKGRASTPTRKDGEVSAPKRRKQQRTTYSVGSTSGTTSKRKYVDFTSSSNDENDDDIDIDMDDASDSGNHLFGAAETRHDHKGKQADRSGELAGQFSQADDAFSFGGSVSGFGQYDSSCFHISANASGARGSLSIDPAASTSASTSTQLQTPALRSAKAVHLGYRCDACLAEPIVGIRWHCQECHGAHAVDLCDECREEDTFETDWHKATHRFHIIKDAEMEPYYANEVAAPALREFSYLA